MADPIRELLSQTSYDADSVTTVWNFSFAGGYLDRSHVKVQVLNKSTGVITQRLITNANFIGDFQLELIPALGTGNELTIYRDTPKDLPLVDFADKGALTEASLDLNAKQAIFVAAESSDQLNVAIDSVAQIVDYVVTAQAAAVGAQAAQAASEAAAAYADGSALAAAASAVDATNNGAAQVVLAANQVALATNEKTAAAASAVLASQWATQLATPVASGEYSAKYHAKAAAASAASIAGGPVASIAGLTGIVTAGAARMALSINNLDNTSDLNKPLSTATLARVGDAGGLTFRNMIMNGDLRVVARNSIGQTGIAYVADRWVQLIVGVNVTGIPQTNTIVGTAATGELRWTVGTGSAVGADTQFVLLHRIEANMIAACHFGTAFAKPITLSFWAQSTVAGTFSASIQNSASAPNRSHVKTFALAANTPTYVTLTFPGDTGGPWDRSSAACGMQVSIAMGGGSNLQVASLNTWNANGLYVANTQTQLGATSGAVFKVTDLQLEVGSAATSFERLPLSVVQSQCHRYWQGMLVSARNYCPAGFYVTQLIRLFVPMRTTPGTYALRGSPSFSNVSAELVDIVDTSSMRYNLACNNTGDCYGLNRVIVLDVDY